MMNKEEKERHELMLFLERRKCDLWKSYSDKININTANSNLLQSLPGIGPVLSERIVEYRDKNGLFSSIEDIREVSGIGEKKFEGIKDLICVQ